MTRSELEQETWFTDTHGAVLDYLIAHDDPDGLPAHAIENARRYGGRSAAGALGALIRAGAVVSVPRRDGRSRPLLYRAAVEATA